jgi:hypothetical protein
MTPELSSWRVTEGEMQESVSGARVQESSFRFTSCGSGDSSHFLCINRLANVQFLVCTWCKFLIIQCKINLVKN